MTALYDQALQPAGVTLPQFSLLRRLDRHGPMSVSALAEMMDLERTTLGRNLKPLKRAGLLQAGVNEADTRERIISVTEAGCAVITLALPMWRRAQTRIEKQIGKKRIQLMHELLEQFESTSDTVGPVRQI